MVSVARRCLTIASTGAREADFVWFLSVFDARPVMLGVRPLRLCDREPMLGLLMIPSTYLHLRCLSPLLPLSLVHIPASSSCFLVGTSSLAMQSRSLMQP